MTDITIEVADREKTIVRTSVIGIVTNVLLVGFKAFVGLMSNSIAIILDAVNNLSDALSSVVTIIGAKLGAKQPDKKHPLGYGRIEYLSSMIVAALVLYAGITSLVESIKKIIHPEAADYGAVTLVILFVAIAAKLILGLYVKKQGKRVNSGALVASGSDAMFDAILSASVLASAVVYLIWGVSLEAYVGVVIAGFIIKAGVEMMIETLNDIIGKFSIGWDVKRISRLNRVIMQLAVYEILYVDDVPEGVAVSEAVRIAKKYDEEMGPFVNGILGAFVRARKEAPVESEET